MTKLLYGGYGHHPSGKQYVYYGDDSHRVGQSVVAPVTNKWTNRTYNTMFTIQRTSKLDTPYSLDQVEKLNGRGINIKTITPGLNLSTLPGSKPFERKSEWKKYSDYVYHRRKRGQLLGKPQKILTPEEFKNIRYLQTKVEPKTPTPLQPKPLRFKGVTIDKVLSGKKKIKVPNYKNVGQKIAKKITKGYLPEVKTKKVWNTDTWEYDKKLIYKQPKTAFDRIKENYKKVTDNIQKENARKRLLGD